MSPGNSPFQKRLIYQATIPVESTEQAKTLMQELETFVKSWHPEATGSAHILEMLKPCCEKPKPPD